MIKILAQFYVANSLEEILFVLEKWEEFYLLRSK